MVIPLHNIHTICYRPKIISSVTTRQGYETCCDNCNYTCHPWATNAYFRQLRKTYTNSHELSCQKYISLFMYIFIDLYIIYLLICQWKKTTTHLWNLVCLSLSPTVIALSCFDINQFHLSGLDTNGCPLGNSKFILLSDNLSVSQWLSACQVEKITELAWSASHNVIGALDNVNISCGHILQNVVFVRLLSIYTLCYHCYFSLLSSVWVVIAVSGSISVQGTS